MPCAARPRSRSHSSTRDGLIRIGERDRGLLDLGGGAGDAPVDEERSSGGDRQRAARRRSACADGRPREGTAPVATALDTQLGQIDGCHGKDSRLADRQRQSAPRRRGTARDYERNLTGRTHRLAVQAVRPALPVPVTLRDPLRSRPDPSRSRPRARSGAQLHLALAGCSAHPQSASGASLWSILATGTGTGTLRRASASTARPCSGRPRSLTTPARGRAWPRSCGSTGPRR